METCVMCWDEKTKQNIKQLPHLGATPTARFGSGSSFHRRIELTPSSRPRSKKRAQCARVFHAAHTGVVACTGDKCAFWRKRCPCQASVPSIPGGFDRSAGSRTSSCSAAGSAELGRDSGTGASQFNAFEHVL